MDIRTFKRTAADSLARASYNPKKLAALHTGAALLLSLILTVLNFVFSRGIDSAAGLANLGNRAILGTIQSLLSLAGSLALPFWEIGFISAALRMARTADAQPKDLLAGFHRLGSVARLYLLQLGMYLLVAFACLQLASVLFSFTPFLDKVLVTMEKVMEQASAAGQVTLGDADLAAILPALIPMYVIFGILFAVVAIPLFYRFRMAQFSVMDDAPGALAAMGLSSRMTRGNRFSLFKLDLQFWWYYGAQLVIAGIAYVDVLLPALGISLPLSADALFFITYGVHLVLQLALAWGYASFVQTTYAHCYDALKQAAPPAPKPQTITKNLPWDQQ